MRKVFICIIALLLLGCAHSDPVHEPAGLLLSHETLNLKVGEEFEVTITELPSIAPDVEMTWDSSNEAVAILSDTFTPTRVGAGLTVTALAPGQTEIVVRLADFVAICVVNISDVD